MREASLRLTTAQRAVHTLRYRPALPACLYARRQRPFFLSDTITARSAPRGGQTQAGRTSEPTASPYHNRYNDRHGEPAPRSRRRPTATQGGKVISREGAKHTQRHGIRRENTATHRDASARYVLRDGRAYAAASCHGTQKNRTTSASSEGFGKVGIGQGLKTGTRRSRCSYSKASPDSALLIQHVRFLRKFPSSSRSSVICEENDNCVRAPQGLANVVPPRPHTRYAIATTRRNPSAHSRPGRTSQRARRAHINQRPYAVNACCPVPSLREKALRLCATWCHAAWDGASGNLAMQSRNGIRHEEGRAHRAPWCTKRRASLRPRSENEAPVPTHVLRPRVTAHRAVPLSGLRTRIRSNATADAVRMRCGTSPGTPSPRLPPDSAQRRARRSQEG